MLLKKADGRRAAVPLPGAGRLGRREQGGVRWRRCSGGGNEDGDRPAAGAREAEAARRPAWRRGAGTKGLLLVTRAAQGGPDQVWLAGT